MIRPTCLLRWSSNVGRRSLATRRVIKSTPLAPEILGNLSIYDDNENKPSTDPSKYNRNPVISAHCIDSVKQQVSTIDSVVCSPEGKIVHGRYGELPSAAKGIPLEYLALLHPAAEGAAAIRTIVEGSKHAGKGTILVYGASQASGFAASQLASAAGHTVLAVVGGEHSGNTIFMESLKGMISEPGSAIPEEYALSKKRFSDLVSGISKGDEGIPSYHVTDFVEDFKKNLIDYAEMYPDTKPAAVGDQHLAFEYMEKDREMFEENMAAYLEQYPLGSPKMDKSKLDAFFSPEQYEVFRDKFWKQTTDVISGGTKPFSAPHIVKELCEVAGVLDQRSYPGAGPKLPFSFSILDQSFPAESKSMSGGPVLGAVIVATPKLKAVAEKIASLSNLRAKGEALQFLTKDQRATFGAACSVASCAIKSGAPIVVVGDSLPGLKTVETSQKDVEAVIKAMDIDEEGNSSLNFFVQIYRSGDFPFYGEYAVHRATETLAGPRQIIVTK